MNFRSQITKSYRILNLVGAAVWLACAMVAAAVLVMILRTPDKGAYQIFLIFVLGILAVVMAGNACVLFSQNAKSLEVAENGKKIILRQFGRTVSIRPEDITQVKLQEKYLYSSFSTKPRKMLVIEAPGVSWQARSDVLTFYDRVVNYFEELDAPDPS